MNLPAHKKKDQSGTQRNREHMAQKNLEKKVMKKYEKQNKSRKQKMMKTIKYTTHLEQNCRLSPQDKHGMAVSTHDSDTDSPDCATTIAADERNTEENSTDSTAISSHDQN
jgi:hypothetical protein